MGFWSQQELGGSERLWLCNYRPPEVNYSYLCLVPPIWTTQAASPLSSLSFSPFSSTPGLAPTTQLRAPQPLRQVQLGSVHHSGTSSYLFLSLSSYLRLFPLFFFPRLSLFLFLSHSFSLPLPPPCTQPALHTVLKRQFPEIFPPWEESAFECGSQGFDTTSGCLFYYMSNFTTWNNNLFLARRSKIKRYDHISSNPIYISFSECFWKTSCRF